MGVIVNVHVGFRSEARGFLRMMTMGLWGTSGEVTVGREFS
jgi:hypothetical protein